MDVIVMRIIKVEREGKALEENWSVDTDRHSTEKGGNDESVMWLNGGKNFTGEQRSWQTVLKVDTWDFHGNLKPMWRDLDWV